MRYCTQRGTGESALLAALRDVPNWSTVPAIECGDHGSLDASASDIVVTIDVLIYFADRIFSLLPGVIRREDQDRTVSQGLLIQVSPDVFDDDENIVGVERIGHWIGGVDAPDFFGLAEVIFLAEVSVANCRSESGLAMVSVEVVDVAIIAHTFAGYLDIILGDSISFVTHS